MSLRALFYNCRAIRFLSHMKCQYGVSREGSSSNFSVFLLLCSPRFNSHSNFNNCKSRLISDTLDIHFYLVEESCTLRDRIRNAPLKKNLLKCIHKPSLCIQEHRSIIFLKWSLAFDHSCIVYQSHVQL